MKMVDFAFTIWMIALLTISTQAPANTAMKTAMTNCREEAVSTGLVEDADITAYVDLCMQAWQPPFTQMESSPDLEGSSEPMLDMQETTTER